MNKITDYNDFLIDSLLESVGSDGVLPFVFTEEFGRMILGINHPIANDLLNCENETKPVTLIDVSKEADKVSLSTSPKIIEYLMTTNNKPKEEVRGIDFYTYLKKNDDLWTKYRSDIKIGKLVKKLFGDKYPDNGKPGRDIESFVNAYKFVFNKDDVKELFEEVEGEDIVKWYQQENYGDKDNASGAPLFQSCMSYGCGNYLMFYAKNPEHIKMLVLFENGKKEKIIGRALIWLLDKPQHKVFMDRVYTVHEYQVGLFIDYATERGWLYKSSQTYGDEPIVDSALGSKYFQELTVKDINLNDEYPYMDTLRYLDQDKRMLSSDRISDVKLIETDGRPYECEWSERYERWINMNHVGDGDDYVLCQLGKDKRNQWSYDIYYVYRKDEAVYLSYYGESIPKKRYDELVVKTTIGTVLEILKEDAVYLKFYGGWALENYVNREMKYSNYDEDYYYKNDVVFSKYFDSYLLEETSTEVYTNKEKINTDWIPDKELDNLTYTDKGDYIFKE